MSTLDDAQLSANRPRPPMSGPLASLASSVYRAVITRRNRRFDAGRGVVTFDLKAGKWAAFEMLNRLQIVDISNNLGDAKSLATHPATTTHMRIGAEERTKLGITDGTIRLSVGLEDAEDVVADLVQALGA